MPGKFTFAEVQSVIKTNPYGAPAGRSFRAKETCADCGCREMCFCLNDAGLFLHSWCEHCTQGHEKNKEDLQKLLEMFNGDPEGRPGRVRPLTGSSQISMQQIERIVWVLSVFQDSKELLRNLVDFNGGDLDA